MAWQFMKILFSEPVNAIKFTYALTVQVMLLCLKFTLLPHLPKYQSFRTQLQRAYWGSSSTFFPRLIHRLPVTNCPESRARRIGSGWTSYIIPGTKRLDLVAGKQGACVIVYAHGGGYFRGEARMYLNYMERWQKEAIKLGLDLTFVSVDYPLTNVAPHPAQQDAFLNTYRYVLDQGVPARQVLFMGDSAGGGCSLLASLELNRIGLPQPAAGIMVSPWFDMALKSFQGGSNFVETDYILTLNEGVPLFAKKWIGDTSGDSPKVNPLYVDPREFQSLPPQLILAGGGDFVLPECKELSALFKKVGLQHELVIEWAEIHLYALGSGWIEPKTRARTDSKIFGWISRALAVST